MLMHEFQTFCVEGDFLVGKRNFESELTRTRCNQTPSCGSGVFSKDKKLIMLGGLCMCFFFLLIVRLKKKKLTVQAISTIPPQFKAKRFFKNHIFDIQQREEKIKEKLITTILEDYQGQSVLLQSFFSNDLPREKKIWCNIFWYSEYDQSHQINQVFVGITCWLQGNNFKN